MNLIKYLLPYKKNLILVLLLATTNQIFSMLDPWVFRRLMDTYITKIGTPTVTPDMLFEGIGMGLLGLVWVAMVSRVAKNFQDYFANVMSQQIGMKIFADTISHAFHLPYIHLEDQSSGQLLQNIQKAKTDIQAFFLNIINIVFTALVTITFVLFLAFKTHRIIGTVILLLFPIMGGTSYLLSKQIKKAQDGIVKESASLAGATTETIRNISLVKILGLESQELSRINNANDGILSLELQKIRKVRSMEFIQGTLINAIRTGLLGVMMWMIYKGYLTLGEFMAFFFYSFYIFGPLAQMGNVMKSYQEAKASQDNLQKILELPITPAIEHPTNITPLTEISFKDVSFAYTEQSETLKDLTLDMQKGKTYAFVGPSGSGKSTILKLLVGLYTPSKGDIYYNNNSLSGYDLQALNKNIGIVTQDPQLFSGSIFENLLFVQPDATREACLEVLQQAQLMEFIASQKDGIDTKIGEGGLKLSGGQKQRLAIARALLRNPELLIFDEATSSLDSIIEREITDTIKHISNLRPNLLTILVAHRLSTIMHADEIFVLEKGSIVETGTHQNLVEEKGLYYALWREQSGVL
jgi:ATP-binding cassette, subfamily B, bacterial